MVSLCFLSCLAVCQSIFILSRRLSFTGKGLPYLSSLMSTMSWSTVSAVQYQRYGLESIQHLLHI
jgi:hypothetical protein